MRNYTAFKRLIGFKEHFLIHEMDDVEKRAPYYEYLDRHGKILVLHCKDKGRLEYMEALRHRYPNMYIQAAHLGVDRKNIEETKLLFERFAEDSHVYFDVSTVYDLNFIAENCLSIRNQVLYGTDCPYVLQENVKRQLDFFENHGEIIAQMNRNTDRLLKSLNMDWGMRC